MPSAAVLQRWYHELLKTAHERGIVCEETNLVDEYLTGRYGFRDDALLHVPLFPDDHWFEAIETKCSDLFDAGATPFSPELDAALTPGKDGRGRRKAEKGMLTQKMYECLKDQKAHFIIVKLHPQCANCRRFLESQRVFVCKESGPKSSRFVPISSRLCFCEQCVQTSPELQKLDLAAEFGGTIQSTAEEVIHSSVFDTRSLFLSLSQENHLQFNTVVFTIASDD